VIRSYVRWMDRVAEWTGNFAMYLIYVMVAVLLFDVLSDRFAGMTQIWTVETAQFLLAAYYFIAGPMTLRDEDHVRLDIIYEKLSNRGKAIADAWTIWIVIFFLAILLWGGVSSLIYSIQTNQRLPSLWAPSLVPIKTCMVVFTALMILQCIAIFFRDLAKAKGLDIDGKPLAPGDVA
jgi:TRAP-type mannitol/chloroaromatic compound transport system permease small subunit